MVEGVWVGWREYGCDGVWRCDGGSVGVMEGGW